jgi:SulP family sulfate permease
MPAWLTDATGVAGDRFLRRLRRHSSDLVAGLTGGFAGIPDGMAASVIVGVPPVHGLYANVFGRAIGGLTSRTTLLVVTTTSASALAVLETIRGVAPEDRVAALLLVTLLAGIFQVIAGLLGLARLASFVSHSVMTGFLMGIATLIVLGQLGTFVGYDAEGSRSVEKAADVVSHASSIDPATLGLGCLAVITILACRRVGFGSLGPILAIALPSLIAVAAGLSSVAIVRDVGEIPSGLPTAAIPDFSLISVELVTGALALAAILFIQTAGVSQALPGASSAGPPSRDLTASGLADVGAACFGGQPVGGSLSQSAINVDSGARSRFASVSSGLWILLAILLFASLVEQVVMTALAGILIVTALGAIDLREGVTIWRTNWTSRATILFTFVLTLVLPIQFAVAGGVILSALLHLATSAADVHLAQLEIGEDGSLREERPPAQLESNSVTMLQVYGSLFYAGARTLARRLPDPGGSQHAVVILRLRGSTRVGATCIVVLAQYADALKERHGRLYIAGLSAELRDQLKRSGKLQLAGVHLFPASRIQGRSVARSYRAANTWLVRSRE